MAIPIVVALYGLCTMLCFSDAWVRISNPAWYSKPIFQRKKKWSSLVTAPSLRLRNGGRSQTLICPASRSCSFLSSATVLQGHSSLLPWWLLVPCYLFPDTLCGPWHWMGHRMGRWPMFLQAWLWEEASRLELAVKAGDPAMPHPHPVFHLIKPGLS